MTNCVLLLLTGFKTFCKVFSESERESVKSVENCRQLPLCAHVKLLHKQKSHFRRENGFWNCQSQQILSKQEVLKILLKWKCSQKCRLDISTFESFLWTAACLEFSSIRVQKKAWLNFQQEFYFNNTGFKHHFILHWWYHHW